MEQEEILYAISSSFGGIRICNEIMNTSMSILISGSEDLSDPNYISPMFSEANVLQTLEKNSQTLENQLRFDWYYNNISPSKHLEIQIVISSSKDYIETFI